MAASVERFDVIIAGGGPVGLTLALALTRSAAGIRVAMVDRRPLAPPPDQRASALSAGVRRVFEALGVWDGMAGDAEPIRAMRITDSGRGDLARPVFLDFEGEVAPGEPFAHMVPNRAVAAALLDGLGAAPIFVAPAEIAALELEPGRAALTLGDGRRLAAPLAVAADGGNSILRRLAGIGTVGHDYPQVGIVTTIAHELPHDGVAYEHFRPDGPFASLPLAGRRSSLVWTETAQAAARYGELAPDALARAIEAVMGSSLGRVMPEEPLQVYPLRLQLARDIVASRLALVGDAAHVVHPVAGQGLNLGLKDVAALAELVTEALRLGFDAGAPELLARYQRWRRFDTAVMAMVTDGMNRLFSNDVPPLRALRDVGLGVVDRVPAVKQMMIRSAAAIGGDAPRLLRGQPL